MKSLITYKLVFHAPGHRDVRSQLEALYQRSMGSTAWTPAKDIRAIDDGLELLMDLPGVRKRDLRVFVEGGLLHIHGMRRSDASGAIRRQERPVGAFETTFPLPEHAQVNRIRVRLRDGVLAVRIPVVAPRRRLKIRAEKSLPIPRPRIWRWSREGR